MGLAGHGFILVDRLPILIQGVAHQDFLQRGRFVGEVRPSGVYCEGFRLVSSIIVLNQV